ncbi:MAG: hypothetical protein C4523_01290 [Myxococcales bacterium]|nr:MAG: hypothetical protein C4523_01290 [Myxococcales bacterium]
MMSNARYPDWFKARFVTHDEAMKEIVKPGATIASGFATSEPSTFYEGLWDFIQKEDIHDLTIKQALFLAPHPICLGDTLQSEGLLSEWLAENGHSSGFFSGLARRINATTKKLEGLKRLIRHYEELRARRIRLVSAFMGGATNIIIPVNALTLSLYPEYTGRNTTRMGVTDMHSVHFPDALESMGFTADGEPKVDAFVAVMTPPDENGELSHGPANGANSDIIGKMLDDGRVALMLYVNPNYPFTRGWGDAPNTIHIERFRKLAEAKKLYVVEDDHRVPALPARSFENPSPPELAVAEHVVNHIELNKRFTYGRAIQVGLGGTGVLAVRALKNSGWTGRSYTEMLEPFTLDLFEAGKIAGTHFIEKDGRRTMIDGKMVCTFTIAEADSDFYKKIHNNPAIIIAASSRVVIPEGFYHGLGINNILAIDFHGHANSGGRYQNHHSGIGGGAMIFRGLARGGVGYLCLKSTFTGVDGKLQSSIMPFMPQGTPISHVGPDLMGGREGARLYVVTEHGVAQVSGQTQSEFIKAMIGIAHPRFRDWLKEEAYREFRIKV